MTSSSNKSLPRPASQVFTSRMPETTTITCSDLDETIRRYTRELGYRLDMIMPADAPREALLRKPDHKGGLILRVRQEPSLPYGPLPSEWTIGRAGMIYRDLIPDRLGGKLVASHIRIVNGGEVPDSVHYHKIDFQIIYCLKGTIRVVYEDQGEPFWLRPGDCVLQPPEIRHRVLEAEGGSEVIEITSPSDHETWFDHETQLPTSHVRPERFFGTQCFVRHLDSDAIWKPLDIGERLFADTEFAAAGDVMPEVYVLRARDGNEELVEYAETSGLFLRILIAGRGIELRGRTSRTTI